MPFSTPTRYPNDGFLPSFPPLHRSRSTPPCIPSYPRRRSSSGRSTPITMASGTFDASRFAPAPSFVRAPQSTITPASSITSLRTESSVYSTASSVPTSIHDSDFECDSEALAPYATGVLESHFIQLDGLPRGTTAFHIKEAFCRALGASMPTDDAAPLLQAWFPVAAVHRASLAEGSAIVAFYDTMDASSALKAVAHGTFNLPDPFSSTLEHPMHLSCRLISSNELLDLLISSGGTDFVHTITRPLHVSCVHATGVDVASDQEEVLALLTGEKHVLLSRTFTAADDGALARTSWVTKYQDQRSRDIIHEDLQRFTTEAGSTCYATLCDPSESSSTGWVDIILPSNASVCSDTSGDTDISQSSNGASHIASSTSSSLSSGVIHIIPEPTYLNHSQASPPCFLAPQPPHHHQGFQYPASPTMSAPPHPMYYPMPPPFSPPPMSPVIPQWQPAGTSPHLGFAAPWSHPAGSPTVHVPSATMPFPGHCSPTLPPMHQPFGSPTMYNQPPAYLYSSVYQHTEFYGAQEPHAPAFHPPRRPSIVTEGLAPDSVLPLAPLQRNRVPHRKTFPPPSCSTLTKLHQGGGDGPPVPSPPLEKNILNLDKIKEGVDTRTTVMIKNIPNKLTRADLVEFIEKVCPKRMDFLYLRIDFKNGCNVGYAFVNFLCPEDVFRFADARLGEKWNLYLSEKRLHMCYANYQGKEALIEKFRNSSIMDEREDWKPKIFYSSGSHAGEEEPFPEPTHLRRKERSAVNRGTLYSASSHAHLHASTLAPGAHGRPSKMGGCGMGRADGGFARGRSVHVK